MRTNFPAVRTNFWQEEPTLRPPQNRLRPQPLPIQLFFTSISLHRTHTMEPPAMSLQCFRCPLTKSSSFATALKIGCTIVSLGISTRAFGKALLDSPFVLTASGPASPLSIVLGALSATYLGSLTSSANHYRLDAEPLTPPTCQPLADSFWLSDSYRFSVRYHSV